MNLHLPIQPAQWTMFLLMALIATLLYGFGEGLDTILHYHSVAISQGDWWRIITGHFLHTNLNHLLLNLGGILVLWALHGEYYQHRNSYLLLLLLCLGTSIGLLFGSDITIYVGLSGVLHGLFAWGVVQDIQRDFKSGWLLLAGLIVKLLQEQIFGASLDTAMLIEADVAVDSHLFGAISGLLCAVFINATSADTDKTSGAK